MQTDPLVDYGYEVSQVRAQIAAANAAGLTAKAAILTAELAARVDSIITDSTAIYDAVADKVMLRRWSTGLPYEMTLAKMRQGIAGMIAATDYTTGDGVTDDATGMQAAMTAAATAGVPLFLPAGTYRIRSQLLVPSGLTMTGPGKIYLDPAAYLDKAIRALGSEGTEINLTVNAAAGAITVTMASTTGLSAGQMVLMRANALSGQNPQEAQVIDSLTGTVATFRSPLVNSYATADTARIVPITPKTDIAFDGVWFDCGATSDIGFLLSLEYVYGVRVVGCKFTNHRTVTSPTVQGAVAINSGLNTRIERCWAKPADAAAAGSGNFASLVCGSQFAAIGNQSFGYSFGIGAFQASHVEIAGNSLRGNRGSGNRGIKVAGCYGVSIAGNSIAAFDSGIKDQDSRDVAITGNTVEQCGFDTTASAINVSNANALTNEAATRAITGNVVRGSTGTGIFVDVGSYHAIISGNIVDDCQGRGILASAQEVSIVGNYIRNWGLAYVGANDQLFAAIYVDRAGTVVGNRGHNTLTTVPFVALSANATRSTVESISGNACKTNDIFWIGAATAGTINGTSIGSLMVNINDPTRRWVGTVGGPQQVKSMTNLQVFTVTCFADGMLFSVALGGGQAAVFFACFSSATIVLLSDPAALFSIASGTANRFNVFKSAASGVISFENRTGGTVNASVSFAGTRITATTDPV